MAYAIGVSHPLSISLFTYGSSQKSQKELLQIVNRNFDLRPGIIVRFHRLRPQLLPSVAGRVSTVSSLRWQRPGPEETHLPEDGLLRTLRQEGLSLGGPEEPQPVDGAPADVCPLVFTSVGDHLS